MPDRRRTLRTAGRQLGAALALFALAGCAHHGVDVAADARPWHDAGQVVVVTTPGWDADHGTLRAYEHGAGGWRAVGAAQPVTVGRAGAAWGIGLHPAPAAGPVKREGDGRAPAGVFRIGTAFGYAANAGTALPYAPMDVSDWCIDVPASPLYNRIVDARDVGAEAIAGSTEPMRRDLHADGDQRYRLGFVVEHNPGALPGAGSCIFAHLWKAPGAPTAGCTAMAPATMQTLLGWLRPEAAPVLVLLPTDEYARLHAGWHLPPPEARP